MTIPDDRGAAALAERLLSLYPASWPDGVNDPDLMPDVRAILGERAVFLPDGLDGLVAALAAAFREMDVTLHLGPETGYFKDAEATIRAALLRSTSPEPRPIPPSAYRGAAYTHENDIDASPEPRP